MEREINSTIIKLKSLLQEKYGKDFREFYLGNHQNDDWVGLITRKEEEDRNPGEYYKIKDNDVVMVD
jgi:hypothetical protein|tara:strand:- start:753 stop:953 length:201 start_codon:yes stop_codon:yes gene_type:complete